MFHFLFDYEVLRVVWWVLLGGMFWGFAVMDGFDLGVATLLPSFGRSDLERRTLINTVGPFWEGNQVWLILGAGCIFGVWPTFYAVVFSGLYFPFALLLFSLILRPVGFKFRSKVKSRTWRSFWDGCLFISGLVPSFCFGAVLGVLVTGLYFYFTPDLKLVISSNFSRLFTAVPLLSGALWVTLFMQQGGLFLMMKTGNTFQKRLRTFLPASLFLSVIIFGIMLVVWHDTVPTYNVIAAHDGPSNPLLKVVGTIRPPAIRTFFNLLPLEGPLLLPFLLFLISSIGAHLLSLSRFLPLAFILHSVQMGGVIFLMGWLNFPLIVPSLTNPNHSLSVWDSSSSLHTLRLIFISVILFLPIIIAYTAWVHKVLFGRVHESWVKKNSGDLY